MVAEQQSHQASAGQAASLAVEGNAAASDSVLPRRICTIPAAMLHVKKRWPRSPGSAVLQLRHPVSPRLLRRRPAELAGRGRACAAGCPAGRSCPPGAGRTAGHGRLQRPAAWRRRRAGRPLRLHTLVLVRGWARVTWSASLKIRVAGQASVCMVCCASTTLSMLCSWQGVVRHGAADASYELQCESCSHAAAEAQPAGAVSSKAQQQ